MYGKYKIKTLCDTAMDLLNECENAVLHHKITECKNTLRSLNELHNHGFFKSKTMRELEAENLVYHNWIIGIVKYMKDELNITIR